MEHYYAMIMAGGGGTRLWPMSRNNTPKQLLPLIDEDSLFKTSVERLMPLFTPEQIYVVTGQQYVEGLRAHAPQVPAENFIVEPYGKDSGPAAALGLAVIQKRDPQATVAVLTADHHIAHKEKFRSVLSAAHDLAQQGHIVTLGISPSFPATGFGYIQRGTQVCILEGFECYHSLGFTEKPNVVTATSFLSSGDYSWNSGMFIWRVEQAMAEFERQQPQIYKLLQDLAPSVDTPDYEDTLKRIWEWMPKISLDFAVMEGAENMAVIPVDIGWSDIGTWGALYDVLPLDKFGNGRRGHAPLMIILDTKNTLVYSDKLTVTIGVSDIVVIDTPDALLICNKDRSQDVKEVVNHLKTIKQSKYL